MKKVNELELIKDQSIGKVQFDKEWFFSVGDMEDYLNEDLSGVESVSLPVTIDGEQYTTKCATWEDIKRVLETEPLEDFRGSVLKNRKPGVVKGRKK